ncbi:hypothetical protein DHEL01_v201502 [Diaporthe helianthi]|uniref:Uncharacterized protein n=1 Tax=Diaporthe helianthi TaxID=158607 RepID=A0A2P5IC72_DIAHE|nr:hypothetical protein DHEL01_v201502 [Diaporthe helianthi]
MSANKKISIRTLAADHAKGPQPEIFKVSDIVYGRICELIPAKSRSVFCRFQGDLRTYLKLQSEVTRESKKISNLISFTSAHIGPDALAVPASTYVRDTWGKDGTMILQMVDDAIRTNQARKVEGTLSNGCDVSITAQKNHLDLSIKGPQPLFAGIIQQMCWLLCVAGDKPIKHLAKYVEQTNQGRTTTRANVETIYTGRPLITSQDGYHVRVSFTDSSVENVPRGSLVAISGHCWKTMTGLTIIARGFAIPPRPRHGSGLEASLPVLRQLFRHGFPRTRPVAMDRPMVLFPPSGTQRVEQDGTAGPVDVFELRLILAADCERPLRAGRNVIYWHFDPARRFASEVSIQKLEDSITVEPWAIDPDSRNFVGWSQDAGLLTTATKPIPLGAFCNLRPRGYFELVVSSISANIRFPAVLTAGVSIAAEKVETAATEADMAAQRDTALDRISSRVFVVWDVDRKRGWLLRGDTVALHVLRVNVGQKYSPEEFDFSALKILKDVADDPSPAYKVLDAFNNQESSLNRIKKGYSEDEDDKEKQLKTSLGAKLDIIYAQLLKLSDESPSLNRHDGNLSGPLRIWFKKKWGTTLRGWDFKRLASFHKPRKNFLASNMETLGRLITEYGGDDDEGDPPEKTVARLSSNQGWEKERTNRNEKAKQFQREDGELGRFQGHGRLSIPRPVFENT